MTENNTNAGGSINRHSSRCVVYAVIKEESSGTTQTICGGNDRLQHVFTTSSNALEIRVIDSEAVDGNMPNFVIEYEGIFYYILLYTQTTYEGISCVSIEC